MANKPESWSSLADLRRRAILGLPKDLWLVQVAIFLNYLGYGAVLPFEIIYLHDGRGFSLGTAGLIVGSIAGAAVLSAPAAGTLIDRFGPRVGAVAGGVALAAGYTGLALAETPSLAFAAAVCAGFGSGALNPSQSTLLATLSPPDRRHRATAVSRVAINAGFGLGGGLGGLVAALGLPGFIALYLTNAASYLVYVALLVVIVRRALVPERVAGGYRVVIRDRAFVQLAITNVAMIAVGWGVFTWLVPPFARGTIGIRVQFIGAILLANALTVVVAQVPISRLAEGRRRALMMALAAALFAGGCLLVVSAEVFRSTAYAALILASVAVGLGECCHTSALMPLVADLAPPALRGRYMAANLDHMANRDGHRSGHRTAAAWHQPAAGVLRLRSDGSRRRRFDACVGAIGTRSIPPDSQADLIVHRNPPLSAGLDVSVAVNVCFRALLARGRGATLGG